MLIMMTMGDFNTSEKASLPNFGVRLFKTKITLKIQGSFPIGYFIVICKKCD